MKRAWVFAALCLVPLVVSSANVAAETLLETAAEKLNAGAANEALEMLASSEPERAGDPAFDLLLGKAALAAGRPGIAVFALERVVALEPDNAEARLQYARAYAAAGYGQQAKQELEAARRSPSSNAAVANAIQALQLELRQQEVGVRRGVRAYLEASGGYDSNVNRTTDERTLFGVTGPIANRFVEQDDGFGTVGGGIDYQGVGLENWDLIAGARGQYRFNGGSASDFDFGSVDGYTGLVRSSGANEWSGTVNIGRTIRDGDGLLAEFGANLRWRHAFGARRIGTLYFGASYVDFDDQDPRDGERFVGGARYTHGWGGALSPVVRLHAYGGTVNADSSRNPQLDYDRYGGAMRGQITLNRSLVLFTDLGIEQRDFDGPVVTSFNDREDTVYRVGAGAHIRSFDKWRITPRVTYRRNDSNAGLSDHDQVVVAVTVRREFN